MTVWVICQCVRACVGVSLYVCDRVCICDSVVVTVCLCQCVCVRVSVWCVWVCDSVSVCMRCDIVKCQCMCGSVCVYQFVGLVVVGQCVSVYVSGCEWVSVFV